MVENGTLQIVKGGDLIIVEKNLLSGSGSLVDDTVADALHHSFLSLGAWKLTT